MRYYSERSVIHIKKLDTCEMQIMNHTLQKQIGSIKALLLDMKDDKINSAYVQKMIDMNKNEILEIHKKKFNYWQGKNGNWNSYLPKENKEPPYGRLISKVNEEKLIKAIIDYYIHDDRSVIIPTFKQMYDQWRETKNLELSDNSILRYDSDYKRFFDGSDFEKLAISEINENTIKKFMLETIRDLSLCREACKKVFSYIRNTVKYARIEKIITDNPVEFLELKNFSRHCVEKSKPIEEQFFNDNELLMIQNGLNELYGDKAMFIPRYGVEMSMLTGMRVGEIAALRWEDIHDNYILIHTSIKHNRLKNEFYVDTTKTKKSRQFPMCDEIEDLLMRIRNVQEEYDCVSEFIFTDGNGGYINGQRISDCSNRLTSYLGIHGGGITALRKTINSNLRRNGVPVTIVASMLGHSPEVNEKYYTYDTSNLVEKQKIIKDRNSKVTTLAYKP